jgi:23S rRNA (cytosine1962-C5)-methyltransferase
VPEPWVRFEDDQLLVVGKPAGVNTHRADTHAQDGMYEWVQRQRPGVSLSVLHRLDKATSGLLVFGKTTAANQSLTQQFESRTITKRYELLVRHDDQRPVSLRSDEPLGSTGGGSARRSAATDFERLVASPTFDLYGANPHTGRTHQVRLHATALGMAIVGDDEHGGIEGARLFLHAAGIRFDHPADGVREVVAEHPVSFDRVLAGTNPNRVALAALVAHEARALLFDPAETDAYLWIDRHHDGFNELRVERLGDVALALNYADGSSPLPREWIDAWSETLDLRAVYEQRRPRVGSGGPASLVSGTDPGRFEVTELGRRYLVDLAASSTSSGLFLDQRETRRRLLATDLTGKTVLNVFAHTGSLSVAAATAGAETLTLDLSRRYLDWARDNLRLNDIDPDQHDFIYGDAVEWMERLVKKGRTFDVVLVDPPSSSTSGKKGKRRWVLDRDLYGLVETSLHLCAPGGTLFVSTNLHRLRWPQFLEHLAGGLVAAGRRGTIETQTLPLDHRSGPGDPPYLKAAWIHLDR